MTYHECPSVLNKVKSGFGENLGKYYGLHMNICTETKMFFLFFF